MMGLVAKHCVDGAPGLDADAVASLSKQVPEWNVSADGKDISRRFAFENYHHTIAFVNAVAWVVHGENHHPDLQVSYGACVVRFTTHDAGGLSENDFISAAKLDALLSS